VVGFDINNVVPLTSGTRAIVTWQDAPYENRLWGSQVQRTYSESTLIFAFVTGDVEPFGSSTRELINPLKPELNSICYLLALLRAHHFLHVSRIRVKL